MTRPLTGRTVFLLFAGGFGIIVAVNIAMAVNAVRTFPGVEVDNTYVASQSFDEDRAAQEALGWDVSARLVNDRVELSILGPDGGIVTPATIDAVLGRATQKEHDMTLDFRPRGDVLVADAPGADGRWVLRLEMTARDGTEWRRIMPLIARSAS